jgi:hypothetical protein
MQRKKSIGEFNLTDLNFNKSIGKTILPKTESRLWNLLTGPKIKLGDLCALFNLGKGNAKSGIKNARRFGGKGDIVSA